MQGVSRRNVRHQQWRYEIHSRPCCRHLFEDKLPGGIQGTHTFFLCDQFILLIVRHNDIRWNEKHKYQKIIQIDQQITKLDIVCVFFLFQWMHYNLQLQKIRKYRYNSWNRVPWLFSRKFQMKRGCSTGMYVCLYVRPFVCRSVCLSVRQSVCQSVSLSVSPSVCPSVSPSIS